MTPFEYILPLLTVAATVAALSVSQSASAQVDTTSVTMDSPLVAQVGAGSPHAWNFVSLTREFSAGHLRPFVTVGLGSFLIGGGAAYYTNPGRNGLVLSAVGGLAGVQIAAALDLRFSSQAGLVLGGSYGNYFLQYTGPLPVVSLQVRF